LIGSFMKIYSTFRALLTVRILLVTILVFPILPGCRALDVVKLQYGNRYAKHSWQTEKSSIEIPFKWSNGHIIIPVSINGSDPLRLALDSGASVTVIFESHRTKNLPLTFGNQISIGSSKSGKNTRANIVNNAVIGIDKIELIDLTLLQIPLEHSPLFSDMDEVYFDGAIGYDLLSRFVVRIDYVSQKIIFTHPKKLKIDETQWRALPLNIVSNVPYLKAQVENQPGTTASVDLLVDTGAPNYLYINPDLHPQVTRPQRYYLTTSKGFNRDYQSYIGRLDRLTFGGYEMENLATSFDMADYSDIESHGLLGNGTLRKFDIVFNYSKRQLLIRPNQHFNLPSWLDRSGLDLAPHRQGALVKNVEEGSGGDNIGIEVGDLITHYNNNPVNDDTFDDLKQLLGSDQSAVELCWLSKAVRQCRPLTLQSRLRPKQV